MNKKEIVYSVFAKHIKDDEWKAVVAPNKMDNLKFAVGVIELEMQDDKELDFEFKITRSFK